MKKLNYGRDLSGRTGNLILHIVIPLVFCSVIAAFQYKEMLADRQQHLERAQMNAQDLGSTLAVSVAGSFESIDLILQSAVDQVVQLRAYSGAKAAALNQALTRLQQRVPSLVLVRAADANGNIIFAARNDPSALPNIADRDYFQTLKNNPNAAMVLSRPLSGRITKRWVLICARRIPLPNGEFGGVVFASIELEGYLNRLSGGQIKIGGEDEFLLRDDDGNVLIQYARDRQNMDVMGSRVNSENLTRLKNTHADSGLYTSDSESDHIERIYYYQRIRDRPINLVVGISVGEVLAEWHKASRLSWTITGSLMALIIFCGYLVYRSRCKQLQAFAQANHAQTQLEQSNLELERLSTTDALTGLANRRKFDEVGAHEWMRAMRKQEPLAAAMVDVDFFKVYNDRYGHQAGDLCLLRIAHALAHGLRDGSDFIARYGGEEFVILLPGQNAQQAREVLERLRNSIEALAIAHDGSTTAAVITISAGYAVVIPGAAITLESLLEQADQSLYAAKRQGKNQVVGASEDWMTSDLHRKLQA